MSLVTCSHCGRAVIPTLEGTCPSCRQPFVQQAAANPFADAPAAHNPYASPAVSYSNATNSNPLFVPALILLVLGLLWGFSILSAFILIILPDDTSGRLDAGFRSTMGMNYLLMVFIAGAIAMLRLRPKWLAWAGVVLGLIPVFGPCMGLTIPIAIWCLVLMRRPDVNASFPSSSDELD
jgi:hypothetical protein